MLFGGDDNSGILGRPNDRLVATVPVGIVRIVIGDL